MTKQLLFATGILLMVAFAGKAQTYVMKTKVTSSETMELLEEIKTLFDQDVNISFTISTYDAERNFDEMPATEVYDDKYLAKYQAQLKKDTTDALVLNALGNYYNFEGKGEMARQYFSSAMRHLSLKHSNNDSAMYYSFRGMLKLNLGVENAIDDMDRAIAINPNDSIASSMYPLFLINNRDFKKAAAYCMQMLDNPGPNPHAPYVFLLSSELFYSFFQRAAEAADDKVRAKYAATDYYKLFDYSGIDKYAERFKDNKKIQNVRLLADVFSLTVKMVFFAGMDNPNPVFTYTSADKARLAELERIFTAPEMAASLNPFTIKRALAFIWLMQQQYAKAIAAFNEAISIFPKEKRNEYFQPADAYDAITGIHYMVMDTAARRRILERKLADMPLGRPDPDDQYRIALYHFIAGDLRLAKTQAEKTLQADSTHFNTLRLLSHLSYLDANPAVEAYAQQAARHLRTADDQYGLVMQFAIYQLIMGDATAAHGNIEIGRQSMEGQPCKLCDKLIEKYIRVL